jgi:regulator of protease activity HflC (stomatin/prohibitin superfamily)
MSSSQIAILTTIISIVFVAFFFNQLYFIVPAGHTAVLFSYQQQLGGTYDAGLHFKGPWKSVVPMQYTLQEDNTIGVDCQSNDAVKVQFDVRVENQLNKTCVEYILRDFGPDYDKRLIHDSVRTNMAQRCAAKPIWYIYNEDFHLMDDYIKEDIKSDLVLRHIKPECIAIHKVKIVKTDQGLPSHITSQYTEKAKKKSDIEYSLLVRNETLTNSETSKQTELASLDRQKAVSEATIRNEKIQQLAELEKQREVNEQRLKNDEEYAVGLQRIAIIHSETERIKQESSSNSSLYAELNHAMGQKALFTPEYVMEIILKFLALMLLYHLLSIWKL